MNGLVLLLLLSATAAKASSVSVLHLSDLHLDTLSDPSTYGPDTFCRSNDNLPEFDRLLRARTSNSLFGVRRPLVKNWSPVRRTGGSGNPFGQYLCDSTEALLQGVIGAAVSGPTYDFVVVTGDWVAHNQVNESTTKYMFEHCASLVASALGAQMNQPIVPVVGNEDFFPDYSCRCKDQQLSHQWDALSNAGFVSSSRQQQTFKSFGGLTVDISSISLRVISVNTILWSQRNSHFDPYHDHDPCGQFNWLDDQIGDAEQNGMRVWIVGHIPPSFNLWVDLYERVFLDIVARHRHTIDVSLWGHTHSNDYVISTRIPEFFGLIQGSITPNPVNPSYRVLSVNTGSSGVDVVDFQDIYADLHTINAQNQFAMNPLFSFAATYGAPVSAKSIAALHQQLVTNATARDSYRDLATSRYDNNGFDMACSQFMNETDYWNCRINETM